MPTMNCNTCHAETDVTEDEVTAGQCPICGSTDTSTE